MNTGPGLDKARERRLPSWAFFLFSPSLLLPFLLSPRSFTAFQVVTGTGISRSFYGYNPMKRLATWVGRMILNKVEICGVNTSKRLFTNTKMRELLQKMRNGEKSAGGVDPGNSGWY